MFVVGPFDGVRLCSDATTFNYFACDQPSNSYMVMEIVRDESVKGLHKNDSILIFVVGGSDVRP